MAIDSIVDNFTDKLSQLSTIYWLLKTIMSCSPIEECTLHPDIHYHYAQQADRQSWGYHGNAFRPHTKCKKNRREKAPHTLEQAPSPIVLHSCVNEQRTAPILSKKNVCSWHNSRRTSSETDWWETGAEGWDWRKIYKWMVDQDSAEVNTR